MKVKVLIPFTDKHTGKKHNKGEIFDVSAKRFNEITEKGKLVEPIDSEKEPETDKKK